MTTRDEMIRALRSKPHPVPMTERQIHKLADQFLRGGVQVVSES